MRITPPPEMIDYLTSIGANSSCPPPPTSASPRPAIHPKSDATAAPPTGVNKPGGGSVFGIGEIAWTIILGVMLFGLLLALGSIAVFGAEPHTDVALPASTVETSGVEEAEQQETLTSNDLLSDTSSEAAMEQVDEFSKSPESLANPIPMPNQRTDTNESSESSESAESMTLFEGGAVPEKASPTMPLPTDLSPPSRKTPTVSYREHRQEKADQPSLPVQRPSPASSEPGILRSIVLMLVSVTVLVWLTYQFTPQIARDSVLSRVPKMKRPKNARRLPRDFDPPSRIHPRSPSRPLGRVARNDVFPPPSNAVRGVTVSQGPQPMRSRGPLWRHGVRSVTGNIRSENQDTAFAFEVDGIQALFIADGCGGVRHGALASRVAILSAAQECAWLLARGQRESESLIRRSFGAATRALRHKGVELGITSIDAGLRTTLIVVLGTVDRYEWGYIGDGAIRVLCCDGTIVNYLQPQRIPGAGSNALAASLGPIPHGQPVFGGDRRVPGDMLFAGTDGIFDRVAPEFPREVLRLALLRNGDLTAAIDDAVENLASVTDEQGCFIFDDNLTLGILMDGSTPRVCRGFWNRPISREGIDKNQISM